MSNQLKWCVVKLRNKETGNQFYDFSKYADLDLLRPKYNLVVLASFQTHGSCIDKIKELEAKAKAMEGRGIMSTITVIKIDVAEKRVYSCEIENSLEGVYEAIGCQTVENVVLAKGHYLLVDEDAGLLHLACGKFRIDSGFTKFNIIGNAVVVGVTPEGTDWDDCTLDVEEVRRRVSFL